MKTGLIIAIDGPAGAGKSSTSRLLAERLGYRYVDTGALYRAVGLLAWEQGIAPDDSSGLAALCASLTLRFEPDPAGQRLYIGGRDITPEIRRPEISQMASKVSAQPIVREHLLTLQRDLGKDGRAVLEGRDIGTVVFPDADLKVYLDASPEARSRRRYTELQQKGASTSLEATRQDMQERDERDSGRAHAPLRAASDAIILDTTGLSLAEVVDALVKRVEMYACRGQGGASGDEKRGK
jgi:cytidylate kinase